MTQWLDIASAPKDGTIIDLWSKRGTYYSDRSERRPDMFFANGIGKWRNQSGDVRINEDIPTHWSMPLPAPPTTD